MRLLFKLLLGSLLLASLLMISIVATGQDSGDLDAFRKLHGELRERMNDDLDEATEYLESKIAAAPDSADLNVLRHSLATKLFEQREYKDANSQFGKLLDFQIKHFDQAENQFGVWMTVQSMQQIADKSGNDKDLRGAVSRSLEALSKVDPEQEPQPLIPISQLTVLQAQIMVDDQKTDQAAVLVREQLDRLREINETDLATEETMQTLVRMLRSLTSEDRGNDSWRDEFIPILDETVSTAMQRYPESLPLQTDYAETQFQMITQWGQADPEATKERIEEVTKKLALVATRNRSVRATLRRIDLHKERMESAKPVSSLVGKPAPQWDVDAWVNPGDVTEDSLKGKVVLIDFWAMWCGPCVATFPHLRQWREEFADKGFEIVGVTQYYNFEWDDENKRASRSQEDQSAEEERETLASFLEHHKLQHPVVVNPQHSEMASDYGVRGIPHVVLIDRDGVVQFVKTGAGQDAAEEIHAKIKELVQAEPKT